MSQVGHKALWHSLAYCVSGCLGDLCSNCSSVCMSVCPAVCMSVRRLDQFHLCCLRKIAGIKWQDRVTNTDVLQICCITGIEVFLLKAQLRWAGHVMRMPDDRIPKQVFCGQLAVGTRPQCGPVRRYKDSLKETMKKCEMQPSTLSIVSQDRSN